MYVTDLISVVHEEEKNAEEIMFIFIKIYNVLRKEVQS